MTAVELEGVTEKVDDLAIGSSASMFGEKKKKKKKVDVDGDENVDIEAAGGDDEQANFDADFDLTLKKKKKKKKKKGTDDDIAALKEELESAEASASGANVASSGLPWAGSDRDYTYDELLDRVFGILKKFNPELTGEKH